MSANQYADSCLLVWMEGGQVYLEPASKVTYTPSRPKGRRDRAFHLVRGSPDWNNRTLDRFYEKWELERSSKTLRSQWRWMGRHRRKL